MSEPHEQPAAETDNWTGAVEAYNKAFELIRSHPKPAVLMLAAHGVVGVVYNLSEKDPLADPNTFVLILGWLLALLFILAIPRYGLKLADGKKISLKAAMRGSARLYFYVLVAAILITLYAAASLIALIIPAIWVIGWYALAQYPVVDKNVNPNEGLKRSRALSTNHKGKVWGLIGVTLLLTIIAGALGFVPVIGVFLSTVAGAGVTIVAGVAFALLYRWLEKHHGEHAA